MPPGPVDVALAGGPAFYGDIQAVSEADLRRSEIVSLPLAALALLVVFGAVVAAGLPLAVGGGAVVVALALIWVVAGADPDEHLRAQPGHPARARPRGRLLAADDQPVPRGARRGGGRRIGAARMLSPRPSRSTVTTAGRAVFFSGLTVLLGLTGLILFEFPILRSVGIAGAIVVGLAVAAALTLLPAILSVLGARIDAGRIRRVNASRRTPTGHGPGSPGG